MDANGSPVEGRFVFGDITNRLNVRQTTPCNEVENKKGETSSKKREYRARKKVEANNPYHEVPIPDKHIAERNIKQREYRARKNSVIEDAHNPITPAKPTEPTACVSVNHETGNSQPTKMSNEQREERNRKQHEYRKWKRDEMNNVDISVLSNIPMQPVTISSSMQSDGGNICRDEKREKQREDRNRKQREYRARKKAESNNAILANFDATTPIIGSSFGTTYSTILQASSVTDNKNGNIDDPTDWLHRNVTYKRQCKRKPVIIEEDKDSPTIDGVTQEETIHVQDAKVHIPDDTYVEFDSGLFEPPLIDFVDEDHGVTAEIHDIADNVDELDMQFQQKNEVVDNYLDNEDDNDDSSKSGKGKKDKFVTAREYYCFRLQFRRGLLNIILFGGRLFQQWVVAMYIKIESMRLDWYSKPENQKKIRAELYQGVVDVLSSGETSGLAVGKRITEHLEPGQQPQDRPDLVTRVFKAKLRDVLDLIVKKKYFGEVQTYTHVTEFQKRGLPHEHILLIMKSGSKLTTPDEYDKVICTEIADKVKYPELHRLVIKHMLHRPCGALNMNCACMVDGVCPFDFPRQFNQATQQGKDSYHLYRRRNDGWCVKIRGAVLDNRWVIPYNPGLLMRYNCHINVEACASIKSVKYLYKYVYKGHDGASFSVDPSGEINEIQQYRNAKYVPPPEAIYRMLGFPLFGIYPAVLQLQLYLPNMQYVTYNEDGNLENVVNCPSSTRTTLTEYFKMNQVDPEARKLLYKEFPEHYLTDIRALWDNHKAAMSEDYSRGNTNPAAVEQMVLRDIRDLLYSMGKDITEYGLPEVIDIGERCNDVMTEIIEELNVLVDQDHLDIYTTLNDEQRAGFDEIIDHVTNKKSQQSGTMELLRMASLIIWDEAAMMKRQAVETLDRYLQDIMGCSLPFGGKVIVFGGDFRQVLPMVTRGTRAQITDATLQRIGNGTENTIRDDYVRLPDEIVIAYGDSEDSVHKLINHVFPSLDDEKNASSASYMSTRAILSTKNDYVDKLNANMIDRFPGQAKVYHSFDSVDDDPHNSYPLDYLNSITPNGLPPHELIVKINCPVILLRNLDPNNGLCNGTRLMVRAFQDNAIDAKIVGRQHASKRVFIPWIPLSSSDDISLPFKFKRKQFPIRLSFAMTINKSQGQTIPNVGIYLP
ncbi:uncharacterized protein [Oryza sativa Japonica Group]|uniref:uncharacterized protein n=1 Tax=Oryza sativa subsp. japonica TaxID=39947 RepID=UPI00339BDF2F